MQIKQQLSTWILAVGLLLGSIGYAQETQEEWSIENSGADELEQLMEFGDGSKGGFAAKSVSLRRFCPLVGNQAGQPSSLKLGWAAGYGMMSILHAQNTKASAVEAFSAQFPFELMPKSATGCRVDNFVPHLRNILTQTGNVKAALYDKKQADCKTQPTENWQNKAAANRIDGLYLLFNKKSSSRSSSAAEIEARTKGSLSKGRPVMAVLMVDDAFRQLKTDTWRPNNAGRAELQPVVVIGYDDNRQAFEVLNSMGAAWGSRGYAWLRYADFCEWSQLGLQMLWHPDSPVPPRPEPDPRPGPRPNPRPAPTPVPPRPVVLRGSGQLRSIEGSTDNAYVFAPVVVRRKGNYYETDRRFGINDGMQFVSDQLPKFGYVYLLSVDATQKVELHFPKSGESAYVADENSRLVFPRPRPGYDAQNRLVLTERQFTKEQNGADWLVVLYSKNRLNDAQLQKWQEAMAVPSQQVVSTVEQLLGKTLVPWQEIKFTSQKMQFSVNANATGSIVPLLVKINGN